MKRQLEFGGGMLERIVGGVMRAKFRIEIAENTDADGISHPDIVVLSACSAAFLCELSVLLFL